MLNFIYRYEKLILPLVLLMAFIPYIYISFYSNPIADDFTYSSLGKNQDLLHALVNQYQGWNGRYISNIFVLMNPIVYDWFLGYKLAPILMIVLTILSLCFFINVITFSSVNSSTTIQFALFVCLLFIYQMPIISEGIYWYTGAVTYQLGNIFTLFYVGILCMLFQKRYILKNKFVHVLVLIIALFLAIGFNEILMLVILSLSMIILFIRLRNKMENSQIALLLLIASAIFSSIMFFAPGNAIRGAYFPDNHQLIHSIGLSVSQTIRFFLSWVSSAPLILLSVLYYFINLKLSKSNTLFSKSFYLTPLTSLLLLFFTIFIGAFPAYWSTGILGQHRTMNVSYFLFIIMWFVNLTVYFNLKELRINKINKVWELTIFAVIWFSFVFTKNGFDVINDLRTGKAYEYNQLMIERYTLINNAQDTVYFKPIVNPPKTIFVQDIITDPNAWINRGYNVYFNVNSKIILKEGALTIWK